MRKLILILTTELNLSLLSFAEPQLTSWITDKTGSYARILKMARKPSKEEFRQTVIVCGIGMFVLGGIGFVMLYLMDNLLPSFFDWLTK